MVLQQCWLQCWLRAGCVAGCRAGCGAAPAAFWLIYCYCCRFLAASVVLLLLCCAGASLLPLFHCCRCLRFAALLLLPLLLLVMKAALKNPDAELAMIRTGFLFHLPRNTQTHTMDTCKCLPKRTQMTLMQCHENLTCREHLKLT